MDGRSSYLKNFENHRELLPLMLPKYKDSAGWIVLTRTHIVHFKSGAGVPAFISWAPAVSLSLFITLQGFG